MRTVRRLLRAAADVLPPGRRAAARLMVATAGRRETMRPQDYSILGGGLHQFYAVLDHEGPVFSRLCFTAPGRSRPVLYVAAAIVQLGTSLLFAPYHGAVVGVAYARGGREAALDAAACRIAAVYVGLLALDIALLAVVGALVGRGINCLATPPAWARG